MADRDNHDNHDNPDNPEESNIELSRQQRLVSAHREVENLLEHGNVEAAVSLCRDLLEKYPGQPGLWVTLAAAATRIEAHDRAVTHLEKAVSIRPAYAPYLRLLGKAYRRVGRVNDAVSVYEKAAIIEPHDSEGLLELAISNFEIGNLDVGRYWLVRSVFLSVSGARDRFFFSLGLLFRQFARLVPTLLERDGSFRHGLSRRVADDFLKHEQFHAAERRYRALLDAEPDDFHSLVGLGRSLMAQSWHSEAEWYLKRAGSTDPESRDAQLDLATVFYHKMFLDEAHTLLCRLLDGVEDDMRANRLMGWILLRMGAPDQALPYFQACVDNSSNDAEASFGIAQSHQALGDFEKYEEWLRRTLNIREDHTAAIQSLVEIDRTKSGEERLEAVRNLTQRDDISREARIQAHFTAAAIEDGLGHFDAAFEHYARANALKDVTFDADAVSRKADLMIEIFSKDRFETLAGHGASEARPIFIVGMPRSGSTLIEQVLASHPDVVGGGEMLHMLTRLRNFRAQCPVEEGDPDYLRHLDGAGILEIANGYLRDIEPVGKGLFRVTDKLLSNVWNLGVIGLAFPNAHIIHVHRDPLDCCVSIFMRDFVGVHSYAYDLRNLGRYYCIQRKLMDYWKTALPVEVLEVRYEDLVADPENRIRGILAHCELEWDARCLEFHKTDRSVATASYAQVRRPIYRSSVGKWERYGDHLSALKDALCSE